MALVCICVCVKARRKLSDKWKIASFLYFSGMTYVAMIEKEQQLQQQQKTKSTKSLRTNFPFELNISNRKSEWVGFYDERKRFSCKMNFLVMWNEKPNEKLSVCKIQIQIFPSPKISSRLFAVHYAVWLCCAYNSLVVGNIEKAKQWCTIHFACFTFGLLHRTLTIYYFANDY